MQVASLPTFDLVVATIGRTSEVARLLDSLARQTHGEFSVVVVDQNADERLAPILAQHGSGLQVHHVRSSPGLSRARNAGLARVDADLVGFPDDDCTYPDDLLERVARRFAAEPGMDALTGRTADAEGRTSPRWGLEPSVVGKAAVWHAGNSASTFVRSSVARRIGGFDEALGLGSGTPWSSGEDTDYLVRALELGARVEYDPEIVVIHELRPASMVGAVGGREGAAVGYILGKHRYSARTVMRMFLRPVGGVLVSFARRDVVRTRFHAQTLLGRVRGYRAGRRA